MVRFDCAAMLLYCPAHIATWLQAELRSAEASRRLGALDLRMSGVQGGLGEHKRDILKLREVGQAMEAMKPTF